MYLTKGKFVFWEQCGVASGGCWKRSIVAHCISEDIIGISHSAVTLLKTNVFDERAKYVFDKEKKN